MQKIFNFFLKNFKPKSIIDLQKAKILLVVDLVGILFLSILIVVYFMLNNYILAFETFLVLLLAVVILLIIKSGNILLAYNISAFALCLINSLKLIFNFSNSPVFNYFMDEFYVSFFIIVFSMFASHRMFVINFTIIISSSIIALVLTRSQLPENINSYVDASLPIYFTMLTITFILTYFFTKFIDTAVKNISKKSILIESQNISMQKMINSIKKSSSEIARASSQLSSISQQVTQNAGKQAVATEEISSAIEQMLSEIISNTKRASRTSEITTESTIEMNQNNKLFLQTTMSVFEISRKVLLIKDIASQTNILSLNASIEAVRAGSAGKGFTVIARAIRKLSDSVKITSEEISELSEKGQNISKVANEKLEMLIPRIIKSAELVNKIVSSSREQQIGVETINNSINQLTEITNENSSSAEEMSASAEELSIQADILNQIISNFKIK